jgi:hypothetical protein
MCEYCGQAAGHARCCPNNILDARVRHARSNRLEATVRRGIASKVFARAAYTVRVPCRIKRLDSVCYNELTC